MKLKLLFPAALLCLTTFSSIAQTTESNIGENWTDRIYVGGNLGFSFGTVTYIEVAPLVGYRITNNWSAGLGGRYTYYKDNYYFPPYETSIYGAMAFTRYNIYKGIFAEADFEANNFEVYQPVFDTFGNFIRYDTERKWVPSLLLGGGYSQSIGGKSAFYISILYDVLQNPNSPYYGQPVFRGGVTFGL